MEKLWLNIILFLVSTVLICLNAVQLTTADSLASYHTHIFFLALWSLISLANIADFIQRNQSLK